MKAAIAVAGIAAVAFALPAVAQSGNALSSVYIGASVGQSKFKDINNDTDTAWRLLGGYQLNRNFSAELGYSNFGEVNGVKANAWELVGVGLFPINNQFGIYGKLGGHHSELKDGGSETGNGLTYGAGLQFDVTPQVGIRGEWQRYDRVAGISDAKIDVLSIGALWHFR